MKEIVRAWGLSPGFPRGPNFFSASLRKEVLYKNLNKIGVGELVMTNIFKSATGRDLPAADRVFATMTDMALWSAQDSAVKPANMQHATMLIKIHMKGIQNLCYSNGAVIRR